jgi:GntR family transcriptional regulator, carbon starvation induced regulator
VPRLGEEVRQAAGPQGYSFPSKTEFAADRLREAIVNGDLKPGERLTTPSLAERLGVSQTPLREAFQRLATEGLVELIDQRGARVASIRLEDLHEIFELRMVLEPIAVRRSMERADEGWRARVTQTHKELDEALRHTLDDSRAFGDAHQQFHAALFSNCDWKWLLRFVETLTDNSRRFRMLSLAPRGGTRKLIQEHADLKKAALAGDADQTAGLLVRHLQLTVDVLSAAEFSGEGGAA